MPKAELPESLKFECHCCGETHQDLPAPAYQEPANAVDEHGNIIPFQRIKKDFCILNDEHFFVRSVLCIPVNGTGSAFEWGVWGSLSQENFQLYRDSFQDSDQSKIGPMHSYLCNELHHYPGSLNLRGILLPQDDYQRPFFTLAPDQDHPLVTDQLNGITIERAIELAALILHPEEMEQS